VTGSLTSTTLRALYWSFLAGVGLRGVQFVIGIILSRLLFPDQFGLIGMLTIFFAVAQTFLDSGFGAALIQRREATPTDVCSIFYFNIAVGLVVAGILCLAAPWIAAFYDQPILSPLVRVLSLTIVLNSFGLVQSTTLAKQINFRTQAKVNLTGGLLSGTVGITLAATGFGVWSLAIQQVANSLFRTLLLWAWNTWRPLLLFSFSSLRTMVGFGSRLLAAGLLNQIFDNMYLVVIGKLFSPSDLGFFTRAKSLAEMPSQTLSEVVSQVTFPVFSTIQDDPIRLKWGLQRAVRTAALMTFPMMIGLAVIAPTLVLILLTDRWAGSIPYLQLLCFLGLLFPVHVLNLNVLRALGRADLFLRLEGIKKLLVVVNIAITWRWGIPAMIYGMITMSALSYYVNSYYTGILIGYGIREQLRDLLPYFVIATAMGLVVHVAGLWIFANDWLKPVAQMAIGATVYVCFCRLFALTAFMDVWQAVEKSLKREPTSA
jgi:teichuronic acid exporter